ncbi:MAG TPA: hypothetical protein VHL80_15295 [Polyangia bacterium]|nr:hypothetical protein [Polyangia bacterium]
MEHVEHPEIDVTEKVALRFGGRALAALAAASLGLAAGCYSTTPHRAQIAAVALPRVCAAAVVDVFARSGFVQLPTPPDLSMLFAARVTGPYSSFMRTGMGVGVKVDTATGGAGTCNVTLEALSPDVDCADMHAPLTCVALGKGPVTMDPITGTIMSPPLRNATSAPACPIMGNLSCKLSYAPGADNDAAVDELARRVQVALGADGRVNQPPGP